MSLVSKQHLVAALMLASAEMGGIDMLAPKSSAKDRDQRDDEDISARQRKRRDKLARRAKRHAAEAKAGDGAQGVG